MDEYKGKVRVVFMNMVVHPDTVQLAHQYSCAAAKQKRFVEYVHAFWEKGFGAYAQSGGRDKSGLGEENILKFTGEMKFDVQKLKADANGAECKARVDEDMAELRKFRVSGTPAFFINGQHIGGGVPKATFKQVIDEKLAIAEKSGVPGAQYYDKEIIGKGLKQFRSKRDARKEAEAKAKGEAPQAPGTGSGSGAPGTGSGSAAPKPPGMGSGSAVPKPAVGSGSAAPKPAQPAQPKPVGSGSGQ